MHKRLPLLAVCLVAAALGASACGPSGDSGSSAPAVSASASASAAPSASPSAAPEEVRGLTGLSAKLYLDTIRKHYPDLDRISDDVLVTHGNALCLARGQDLVDQAKKTKQELELSGKQASAVLGTAHGLCGRNVFG
ncbi:hypothetical protein IPZ58_29885 [Streptomyces roseoverticillatus]|uniref:hypothetical protein n=1 Tax=Streptomyces roseoverticillatus TaxID=66429 RepID=UPI001F172AFD|nr:hypothetical protein [Streptomyces roseoverticillatus]MCF3105766.1 hypothetical protein [Streptomyces roseoverticillatus]